ESRGDYRVARLRFLDSRSDEDREWMIEKGKDSLHAALDEAEAWLIWINLDAQENDEISDEMKETIEEDVNINLDKIDTLRIEVDNIETRDDLVITFIRMVSEYLGLLTDSSRNVGMIWVSIASNRADTIEDLESRLRETAEGMGDNERIIDNLDMALEELEQARENIEEANSTYGEVRIPGQPLIKFSEANNYLRAARTNMLSAHKYLNDAFNLMAHGGA
ncbi:MAG: hypothetical protein SVK08_09490, partial [Halobacteriota archaeon]|nr:hypothetical protein [Halobacteriota archaeon]